MKLCVEFVIVLMAAAWTDCALATQPSRAEKFRQPHSCARPKCVVDKSAALD